MKEKMQEYIGKFCNRFQPPSRAPRVVGIIVVSIVALCLVVFGSAVLYGKTYAGKIYPGVQVGNIPAGGLTTKELQSLIENANDRYAKEGILIRSKDKNGADQEFRLDTVVAGDTGRELLELDSRRAASDAYTVGRTGDYLANLLMPLYLRVAQNVRLPVPVMIERSQVITTLQNNLAAYEDRPHNAGLAFKEDGVGFDIVPERSGVAFYYDKVLKQIETAMGNMSFAPVVAELEVFEPTITTADVEAVSDSLAAVMRLGGMTLSHIDPATQVRRDWDMKPAELSGWTEVRRDEDGRVILALNRDAVEKYLISTVRPITDVEPKDAKFSFVNGKVKEFQASRTGLALNVEKTYQDLDTAFRQRNYTSVDLVSALTVPVDITEPAVKTADVNSLGITDVIGVGVSSFKDSHTNRIKNIANAISRLNGTLVKPGEEFSANKAAGPYTEENGFLPEMVIKGNEIKPEVGGGMCQVGTTLFRMAMNAGMPITERRNHSLVVSYYADPVNGNPGTDATLYEPILDFKFLNDTENYILIQTDIDYKKQQLTFTLWGKPDGRKGSYTHPIVSKWIPAGEKQMIYVDDGSLKPGETKCQNAFRGAVASFVYTRFTSSSEKIERTFDSYYRPLPQICMVGVEKGSCGGKPCTAPPSTPSSTPSAADAVEVPVN